MSYQSFLVAAALAALMPLASHAADCSIAQPHPLTPPQMAMMSGKYAEAEALYRAELAKSAGNEELTAGLVYALLGEQRVDDAATTIQAALSKNPQSPALLTSLAAVQHRQGLLAEEEKALQGAQANGLCYAPVHLALANYYRFNSYYARALQQITIAHQLNPYDPAIWREWMRTLPKAQQIEELKKYLADHNGDTDEVQGAKAELAVLESEEGSSASCKLVSQTTSADIPFAAIRYDAQSMRAWGLEVAFNGKKSRLVIDTGASGLYINRSLAKRAGLKPVTRVQSFGIGDNGPQGGYLAVADSIKIGGLEFRNCLVEVSDRRNVVGDDGLIGMNVFSKFAVTLDFPWHKLTLGPLPPYPGTAVAPVDLNTEGQGQQSGPGSGPHDRYVAPEMADWMKIYHRGYDLIIPGVIDNKKAGLFLIDTGAQMSSLSPQAAAAVTKVHGDDGMMTIEGVSGKVKKIYYADDVVLRFGHLQQKSVRMTVFDLSRLSGSAGTEISGMLSSDALDLLVIHIDYRDGLMKFEYSPHRGYQDYR